MNFSFIIPHKNAPDLLQRCLDSIPQREDVEIIVVDDNSEQDKRPQISRKGVVVLFNKDNLGAGHARNIGLVEAKGKWVLFADCDDYYEKETFDVLYEYADSQYDIIFFDSYVRFNTSMNNQENSLYCKYLKDYKETGAISAKANLKHCLNAPWNKMYRRDFIIENQLKFEEIPIGNDAYFVNMASSLTSNVFFLSQKLYYYVDNPAGITRKKRRSINDLKILFESTAKVDIIKYKSGATDTIYPIIYPTLKRYIKDYGLINTIKLYMIKFCYPNYPLFSLYSRKILKRWFQ